MARGSVTSSARRRAYQRCRGDACGATWTCDARRGANCNVNYRRATRSERPSLSPTHDPTQFAVLLFFTDRRALVVLLFAMRDADLDLDAAVLEIKRQR